ncbi:MAG: Glucose/arabinose dehydrogenase, beta-propeller fold [Verrucomicrobia bacterium]|nr:MAG: Glucose/arabinose dehydrogenase, beta-propeller fold [Verrucomicrobiota bacterium]
MRSALFLFFLLSLSVAPGQEALTRTPWISSRVQGSPDPPKAFTTAPVFRSLEFREALEMISVPGQDRMLVVEKAGRLLTFPNRPEDPVLTADLVIDLKTLHSDLTHAYGVAFHPRYRENRQIFVTYVLAPNLDDGSKLSRFRLRSLEPPSIDPASEEVLLTWRSGGHNGANIRFGPDGYVYLSTGDAEVPAPPDPLNTGQDLSDLLSSILRIDVDHADPATGRNYRIPPDNPFLKVPGAKPENWAYGLRNPWKMSFDPASGRLWCGDVGWEQWEMIHLIQKGGNYGWSAQEASQAVRPDTPSNPSPITPPVISHSHSEAASITGGHVYHGKKFPELKGAYVYGDYETGKVWALWHDGVRVTRHEEIADTPFKIVTFGQDEAGEIYLIHWRNPSTILSLTRQPNARPTTQFPRKLSETGLFTDVPRQEPAPGVYPYEIAQEMWQDGAIAKRFVGLPGTQSIKTEIQRRADGGIARVTTVWPKDSVLLRTLSVDRPVETQVLHFDGEAWNGYSYRWDPSGQDAELLPAQGHADLDWHFSARGECGRCHNSWSGFALGFQPQQLTSILHQPADAAATTLGLTDPEFFGQTATRLTAPNPSATTANRARAWLHANCAHCHRLNGGGSVAIMLNAELPLEETRLLDEIPTRGTMGLPEARIVAPGAPWRSVLLNRILRVGNGHMPPIGTREPDPEGIALVKAWIASMPGSSPEPQSNPVSVAMKASLEEDRKAASVGLQSSDPNIRELFERFRPASERPRLVDATTPESALLALSGNAARGRILLHPDGKLASCLACHFVLGQGREFGPDLSLVGKRLNKPQILASLLRPSETIDPTFRGTVVETRDGIVLTGFPVERTAEELHLKLPTGQVNRIPTQTIVKESPLPASLMPEQLLQGCSPQEVADLLAFLVSLRS